jgi:hypothetical protein
MTFDAEKHPRDESGRWKVAAAGGVLGSALVALGLHREKGKVADAVAREDARHEARLKTIKRRQAIGRKADLPRLAGAAQAVDPAARR